jgi:hypothetical protein
MARKDWYHVSSHGAVLFCMAVREWCSAEELADTLGLSRRRVWSVIRDLRRAEMVRVSRNGRRSCFAVNLDAPLLHPAVNGYKLRDVMGGLAAEAGRVAARGDG